MARQLAAELRAPLVSKDDIKELLFEELGWSDREWSRTLGVASWVVLYRELELLLSVAPVVVAEGNFYTVESPPHLERIRAVTPFRTFEVHMTAAPPVLVARYRRRHETGERHPGHVDNVNIAAYDGSPGRDGAPMAMDENYVVVDTTDFSTVRYDEIVEALKVVRDR